MSDLEARLAALALVGGEDVAAAEAAAADEEKQEDMVVMVPATPAPAEDDDDEDSELVAIDDAPDEVFSPLDKILELWHADEVEQRMIDEFCNMSVNGWGGIVYAHVATPKREFVAHVCSAYLSSFAYATVKLVCDAHQIDPFLDAVNTLYHETYTRPVATRSVFGDTYDDNAMVIRYPTYVLYHLQYNDTVRRLFLCTHPASVTERVDVTVVDAMHFADPVRVSRAAAAESPVFTIVVPQAPQHVRAVERTVQFS